MEDILLPVRDSRRLRREQGVLALRNFLALSPENLQILADVEAQVLYLLSDAAWESRHGGILASKLLVSSFDRLSFRGRLYMIVQNLLEDPEQRVRLETGELLEILAQRDSIAVYSRFRRYLLNSIDANFERESESGEGCEGDQGYDSDVERADERFRQTRCQSPLSSRSASPQPKSPVDSVRKATSLRIESEGWRSLESGMKAVQHLMKGTGQAFSHFLEPDLLQLVYRACSHSSRFVRDIGFVTCAVIAEVADKAALERISGELIKTLATGLSDNWSAVRFGASIATRALITRASEIFPASRAESEGAVDNPVLKKHLAVLIPPMCLNRYYLAEGVRLYSQQSWKLAVGDRGRDVITSMVGDVATFYASQSLAPNYFVREAACQCFGELAAKIERPAVAPHLPQILQFLLSATRDESWPVRSAAGVSLAKFAKVFPDGVRPLLDDLYSFWFEHLTEHVPKAREDAAISLGIIISAYADEAKHRIYPTLEQYLLKAKEQPVVPAHPEHHRPLPPGVTAVTSSSPLDRPRPANEEAAHTGLRMYSTEDDIGPVNRLYSPVEHRLRRAPEPWEMSDGAVYLVRELATADVVACAKYLPAVADLASVSHFPSAHRLGETIWRELPDIAQNMGSKRFKGSFLELFLPALFKAVISDHQSLSVAAQDCVQSLQKLIGPSIFKARLSSAMQDIMRKYVG